MALTHDPTQITLDDLTLLLEGTKDSPAFQSQMVSPEGDDQLPYTETVPWGYFGLGSSLPAVQGQHDYGLDVDAGISWDELRPGLLHRKVGLALDSQVMTLDMATPKSEDSGFTQLGTWSDDAGIGTVAWTNPTNAQTSNDLRATVTLGVGETSHYLKGLNSGSAFTIPTDATVLGIAIETELQGAKINGTDSLNWRLVLGGVVQTGTNGTRQITQPFNTATDFITSVGGPTDLFGQPSITPAQVNATDFGVTLHVAAPAAGANIQVDRIRVRVYYGASGKLLYAGGGAVLTKLRFALSPSPTFTTVETKTFIHGAAGAPVISDVLFIKGGDAAGDGFGLAVFGNTASLQQIDVIRAYDDDTYRLADGVSGATYGEKLATALGIENTEALVWKSVGQSGESGGVFSRVHAASAIATTKNYTLVATWTPRSDTGMPYQVGQYDTGITALTEWARSLFVGKPEGAHAFDQLASAFKAFDMRAFTHPDNGKNTQAFQTGLLIPTGTDIAEYPAEGDAYIGLTQLLSNLSPIQGQPTALTHYGPDLYAAYFDGTDSWIVRMRRTRPGEPVPHPFVIHGQHRVENYQITVMEVFADAGGNVMLCYPCPSETADKHDIAYVVLDPPSLHRYATGGELYTTRMGDPAKPATLEELTTYGVDCAQSAAGTISFVGATEGAGGSPTADKPLGVVEDDVLVGCVWSGTSGVTAAAGFVASGAEHDYGGGFVSFWVNVAGASEPSSYTWGNTGNAEVSILAFRGVNPTTPVANAGTYQTQGPTTTPTTPAVTISAENTCIVAHCAGGSAMYTPPAGMTEVRDVAGITVDYQILAGAGPGSTSKTWTANASETFGAGILVLQPLTAQATWEIAVAWDEGAFSVLGTVNAPGRKVLTTTPGVNDNGTVYQLRAVCTNTDPAAAPRLRAITTGRQGAGGLVARGTRMAEKVEKMTFSVRLAEGQSSGHGGRVFATPVETYDALKALVDTTVDLIDRRHFGNDTPVKVRVESVGYVSGERPANVQSERHVQIIARRLFGV